MGGYYYSVVFHHGTISSFFLASNIKEEAETFFSYLGFEIFAYIYACSQSRAFIVLLCEQEENFPKRKTLLEHVNFKTTFHVRFS